MEDLLTLKTVLFLLCHALVHSGQLCSCCVFICITLFGSMMLTGFSTASPERKRVE